MSAKIGFVGTGIMGQGMVRNLLKNGFKVSAWNRTPSKAAALVADGASHAPSLADCAHDAGFVVLCTADTPDSESVLFREGGIADSAAPGATIILTSTIDPGAARSFSQRLAARNLRLVDAPMSGGSEGAAKGTLTFMVGASDADFAEAHPVLAAMGRNIIHVGVPGQGQTVKLVNQILVAGSMLAMGEALLFAQAAGVDLSKTLQAVSGGAAGSWTLTNRGPQVIARDWRPGFTIALQEKDLRLARQAGDALGVPLLMTETASSLYRSLLRRGLGEAGNHALVRALESLCAVEVGAAPSESKPA